MKNRLKSVVGIMVVLGVGSAFADTTIFDTDFDEANLEATGLTIDTPATSGPASGTVSLNTGSQQLDLTANGANMWTGREGAPIMYQAWVCRNPECGFNIRIDNGEISFGRSVSQSFK